MEEKFDEVFLLFNKDVYRLAYSYVLNKSDSEDIVQKTFYKFYKNIKKLNIPNVEVKKWLFRVAINESKNLLKSLRFRSTSEIDENAVANVNEKNGNLISSFKKVNPKYRFVLYLFYYEGYSIEEISKILNKSTSAVKMRLLRGKEQLRMEMERWKTMV